MARLTASIKSEIPKAVPIAQAIKSVLSSIVTLPAEKVKLTAALGRILAEDIYADSDIPSLDNSAMDGYAVKAVDLKGASVTKPKTLDVIEDLRAGYLASNRLKTNQAIRIMTGAPLPAGADSVVMVEFTEKEYKNKVKIFAVPKCADHVRRRGEDIKKDELVISAGTLLASAHIGILASVGKAQLKVTRKPKVAILATGDEVIDVGDKLTPGKLRSSNSYTLYSQIIKCGGIPHNLGIAKDKPDELEAKLNKGTKCDLILTSGGISVGDYDLVKFILAKMGTKIKFWKVAMKPGKPLVFGLIKGVPIFGLPGNPVSSMISFEVFVRPAILKMLGQKHDNRKEVDAVLEENLTKKKDLTCFVRAITTWQDGVYFTRTTGPQGSGILKSMILANSLIVLPEGEELAVKGTRVTVRFLE